MTTGGMSILALVCMATGTCAFAGRVLKEVWHAPGVTVRRE